MLALAQISAATVAASSTAALPVSVRRNWRSWVSRCRAHAVRPDSKDGCGRVVSGLSVAASSGPPSSVLRAVRPAGG